MCLHLVQGAFAQVVPQMPAVTDLHGVRQGPADGFCADRRPVTAHDLGPRMRTQLHFQRAGRPAGQDIDPFVGLGVDHHGRIAAPPAQSEVVHTDHSRYPPGRQGYAQQGTRAV